jgi:CheY-like chemotaxis protein
MASPTILVVEAERLTATPLTRLLKAGGYEALNARPGTAALAFGRPNLPSAGIDRQGGARVSAAY